MQYFGIALPRSETWAPFVAVNWDFLLMAALYATAAFLAPHFFSAAYLFSQDAASLSHLLFDPQRAHTRALKLSLMMSSLDVMRVLAVCIKRTVLVHGRSMLQAQALLVER